MLKIIKDNFHPGDKVVANAEQPSSSDTGVEIQGFITPQGKKVLLVNRTNSDKMVTLPPEFQRATSLTVDGATGDGEPRRESLSSEVTLAPFAVTVITLR